MCVVFQYWKVFNKIIIQITMWLLIFNLTYIFSMYVITNPYLNRKRNIGISYKICQATHPIYKFTTSVCMWRRFWGVGEGRGRWSSGQPVATRVSLWQDVVFVLRCKRRFYDPPKWFFRTLSVCVFAVRFGICCAWQWHLKRVRFNALWSYINQEQEQRQEERGRRKQRERESYSNVFGVCCGYNGVRKVRLNALRSQIDSKNTNKSFAH